MATLTILKHEKNGRRIIAICYFLIYQKHVARKSWVHHTIKVYTINTIVIVSKINRYIRARLKNININRDSLMLHVFV